MVTIPHNFTPREYQLDLLRAIDNGIKRAFCLWHRRAGKDVTLWNLIIKKACERVGVYYYLLPTYTQAKKIIWDGITNDGWKFLDYIPDELIEAKNGQELKITLRNGSIIQLIGTDNYDAIRGTNPVGCVFSEFAYQNPMAWEVVKPILKVNGGWAVFNTTPNGKNHSWELHNTAKEIDSWYCQTLSILDTGVLSEHDMEDERAEGMSEEMIAQEYYCSYDVGVLGSYYHKQLLETNENNRICSVPEEKTLEVDLWLDIGRSDATSIGFIQTVGKEIHFIDYMESNGEDVAFYVKELHAKGYRYGTMNLPHDAGHKRLESKRSVAEQFSDAGFKVKVWPAVTTSANVAQSGIQKVRKMFPRFWFDKEKCKQLIRAIENYHKEYDAEKKVFKDRPVHDWSSHGADMLKYLATYYQEDHAVPSHGIKITKYNSKPSRSKSKWKV